MVSKRDDDGFDAFMTSSWASLYRTAVLMTGDTHLAEDLLQNAMGKVYRSWTRVARVDHPRSYARTVLANEVASWWRKKSSSELPTEPSAGRWLSVASAPGVDDQVVQKDLVWHALAELAPRQRAVLVLRYYEDLTEAEIAAALGISPGTVKATAHQALQALEGKLTAAASRENGSQA